MPERITTNAPMKRKKTAAMIPARISMEKIIAGGMEKDEG